MKENFFPEKQQPTVDAETERLLKNQKEILEMDIDRGDILISKSGTRRQIIEIKYDLKFPGGGWVQVETFIKGKPPSINTLAFEQLLAKKSSIAKIDRIEREQRGGEKEN